MPLLDADVVLGCAGLSLPVTTVSIRQEGVVVRLDESANALLQGIRRRASDWIDMVVDFSGLPPELPLHTRRVRVRMFSVEVQRQGAYLAFLRFMETGADVTLDVRSSIALLDKAGVVPSSGTAGRTIHTSEQQRQ